MFLRCPGQNHVNESLSCKNKLIWGQQILHKSQQTSTLPYQNWIKTPVAIKPRKPGNCVCEFLKYQSTLLKMEIRRFKVVKERDREKFHEKSGFFENVHQNPSKPGKSKQNLQKHLNFPLDI